MARKMPKNLQSWLIPKLRRHSMYWPGKSIAREMARVEVQIGNYKNGRPKFKTVYECAECARQNLKEYALHEKEMTQMDHIDPVIGLTGFVDWNTTLANMFCPPNKYQCLCLEHHYEKTGKENVLRKTKKPKKSSKRKAQKRS